MAKRITYWAIHLNKRPKKLNYTYSSKVSDAILIATKIVKELTERHKILMLNPITPNYIKGTNTNTNKLALVGEQQKEILIDKNKNYLQMLNNSLVAHVSVSTELAEQLNKISVRLKNIPKIKASN